MWCEEFKIKNNLAKISQNLTFPHFPLFESFCLITGMLLQFLATLVAIHFTPVTLRLASLLCLQRLLLSRSGWTMAFLLRHGYPLSTLLLAPQIKSPAVQDNISKPKIKPPSTTASLWLPPCSLP